jgi:hypothetical protein
MKTMNLQAVINYDATAKVFTVTYTYGTQCEVVKYASLETLLGALRDIYGK